MGDYTWRERILHTYFYDPDRDEECLIKEILSEGRVLKAVLFYEGGESRTVDLNGLLDKLKVPLSEL